MLKRHVDTHTGAATVAKEGRALIRFKLISEAFRNISDYLASLTRRYESLSFEDGRRFVVLILSTLSKHLSTTRSSPPHEICKISTSSTWSLINRGRRHILPKAPIATSRAATMCDMCMMMHMRFYHCVLCVIVGMCFKLLFPDQKHISF